MENRTILEIGWRALWRVLVFGALVYIFYTARHAFGVLFISIIVSMGLEPFIAFLERLGFGRILSAVVIFFAGLVILALLTYFVVPIIVSEVGGFLEQFNQSVSAIFGISLPQSVIKNLSEGLDRALNFLASANISIPGAIGAVIKRVVLVFAAVMISFYLVVDKGGTEKLLRVIMPNIYEKQALVIFNRFKLKIRTWLTTQLMLSLAVGLVVTFGLWLLGVKYFFILGFLAAAFELIPVIGPIFAGATAFLVAISDSLYLGIYTAVFFFLVQQLENHILIPLVMGNALRIHPVVVIISLLVGAEVAGFIGIVLAVPIALAAQEIFDYLAQRKNERPALGL